LPNNTCDRRRNQVGGEIYPLPRNRRSLIRLRTFAVNLVLHALYELPGEAGVTCRMPHFDQCLPFPVMGRCRVVLQCLSQTDGQLSLPALGPEAEINAENWPLTGDAGK